MKEVHIIPAPTPDDARVVQMLAASIDFSEGARYGYLAVQLLPDDIATLRSFAERLRTLLRVEDQ